MLTDTDTSLPGCQAGQLGADFAVHAAWLPTGNDRIGGSRGIPWHTATPHRPGQCATHGTGRWTPQPRPPGILAGHRTPVCGNPGHLIRPKQWHLNWAATAPTAPALRARFGAKIGA